MKTKSPNITNFKIYKFDNQSKQYTKMCFNKHREELFDTCSFLVHTMIQNHVSVSVFVFLNIYQYCFEHCWLLLWDNYQENKKILQCSKINNSKITQKQEFDI